jgi:hypothetical protein
MKPAEWLLGVMGRRPRIKRGAYAAAPMTVLKLDGMHGRQLKAVCYGATSAVETTFMLLIGVCDS